MPSPHIPTEISRTLSNADRLRRDPRVVHHEPLARAVDILRDQLVAMAQENEIDPSGLAAALDHLADVIEQAAPQIRARARALLARGDALLARLRAVAPSREIPSEPLLGRLPLARVIPQDIHSVMDYAAALTTGIGGAVARTPTARTVGAALCAGGVSVSAMTDYRLAARHVIPIETHEAIDYLWGIAAMAAPFVFGYHRKDPVAAAMHIAAGAGTILSSLVTDYRAAEGVGHGPRVPKGLPDNQPMVDLGSAALPTGI